MKYTANQKKVLSLLLDKYENSRTYTGNNSRPQSFSVAACKIWEEYCSDFTDVCEVKDFEHEMYDLEKEGLVKIETEGQEIKKVKACNEYFSDYYRITDRKEKRQLIQEEKEFYLKWREDSLFVLKNFCQDQIDCLENGQKTKYSMAEAEEIFRFLRFLYQNKEELLEREVSNLIFHDSKIFKQKYRSKICSLIQKYGDVQPLLEGLLQEDKEDQKMIEKIILEEFHIYENFSQIWIKGSAQIVFETGDTILLKEGPVALSSEQIGKISSFIVKDDQIITVENLTSFYRVKEENSFYLFLSGYHNRAKQKLLKKIAKDNETKKWYHFGDIDPDGFYILENLKKGTHIPFEPMKMGLKELKQYKKYGKTLEKNDVIKAKNLIEKGCYQEIMEYMLKHNLKLEQEIVSFDQRMDRKGENTNG